MKINCLGLFLSFIFLSFSCISQENLSGFIENKGQFDAPDSKGTDQILFKLERPGCDIYLTDKGVTYFFYKALLQDSNVRNADPVQRIPSLAFNRVEVELVNARISREQVTATLSDDPCTFNYYYPACPQGIMGVRSYTSILIRNVYPGIDWVLEAKDHHIDNELFTYEFNMTSDANPEDIRLRYQGAESLKLTADETKLQWECPLRQVNEGELLCYGITSKKKLPCTFEEKEGTIGFSVKKENTGESYVIDPTVWSTYYGGSDKFEEFRAICLDASENVYITGTTTSYDFPVQAPDTGYFQGNFYGASDIVILKFDKEGKRRWATYYGGSNYDEGWDIKTGPEGDIYLTGLTVSFNFPLQSMVSAYNQSVYQSGWPYGDAFILRFDTSGIRKWATFFGGNGNDMAASLCFDKTGNLYIAGETYSTDLPVKIMAGAYNDTVGYGDMAFIAGFAPSGSLMWSTYFKGVIPSLTSVTSIACDSRNKLIISGFTQSDTLPCKPYPGAFYQPYSNGMMDAFVARFDASRQTEWVTFLGGEYEDTPGGVVWYRGQCMSVDDRNNIYITGTTYSDDFPLVERPGAYMQTVKKGYCDAFLVAFDSIGALQWSTYFGGTVEEGGYALVWDHCQHLFCTGYTTSLDLPLMEKTDQYFQPAMGDTAAGQGGDVFLAEFTDSGQLLYSTYFGGPKVDRGYSVVADGNGLAYFTGIAGSALLPMVDPGNGAYFQLNSMENADGYIIKMKYSDPIQFELGNDTTLCEGESIELTVNQGFESYCWQDGYIGTNRLIQSPGTYRVEVSNLEGCKRADSIKVDFLDCEVSFEIPNVFTPNNDQVNDFFTIHNIHNISSLKLSLFNRWGQLLFESTDPEFKWDGKHKGTPCSDGVYFWVIQCRDTSGRLSKRSGSVSLLR
ncbi:MAG: gliding motility-associated C-terminal domain-containing protein [Bacteroidetes bacterium]|nr:gliding motility-associated C-terminal domain-containing protein [Bacteroidota bacterium]